MKCTLCNSVMTKIGNATLNCCEQCVANLPTIIEDTYTNASAYGESYTTLYATLDDASAKRVDRVWTVWREIQDIAFPTQRKDAIKGFEARLHRTIANGDAVSATLDAWWNHVNTMQRYEDILFKSITVRTPTFEAWIRKWNVNPKSRGKE